MDKISGKILDFSFLQEEYEKKDASKLLALLSLRSLQRNKNLNDALSTLTSSIKYLLVEDIRQLIFYEVVISTNLSKSTHEQWLNISNKILLLVLGSNHFNSDIKFSFNTKSLKEILQNLSTDIENFINEKISELSYFLYEFKENLRIIINFPYNSVFPTSPLKLLALVSIHRLRDDDFLSDLFSSFDIKSRQQLVNFIALKLSDSLSKIDPEHFTNSYLVDVVFSGLYELDILHKKCESEYNIVASSLLEDITLIELTSHYNIKEFIGAYYDY